MGLRSRLNQRPLVAALLAVGMFVLAGAVLIVWATSRTVPGRVDRAYYSDDEGKTYFADSVDRIYPFDHNGKQAYRAYVYQCGDGQPFVAYLARYNEGAMARLAELNTKQNDASAAEEVAQLRTTGIEVKRPGDTQWVALFSTVGEVISQHPTCPDGMTATPISPPESAKTQAPTVAGAPPPLPPAAPTTGATTTDTTTAPAEPPAASPPAE